MNCVGPIFIFLYVKFNLGIVCIIYIFICKLGPKYFLFIRKLGLEMFFKIKMFHSIIHNMTGNRIVLIYVYLVKVI